MVADSDPPRPPVLPELGDIGLLAAWECGDPKAGEIVIPKEFPILAGGTKVGVD